MEHERGFTLVEAAVAGGVVAILAGLSLPLVLKPIQDAKRARARHDLGVIAAALLSQMKDTGCRPVGVQGGPGGADARAGHGQVIWHSEGLAPRLRADGEDLPWVGAAANRTFRNLFCPIAPFEGNELFGLGHPDADAPFQFKGPYLSDPVAHLTDPWGHAYLILGFDEEGQREGGPIWVVCTGASGTVEPVNLGGYPFRDSMALSRNWVQHGLSAGNLALRVN